MLASFSGMVAAYTRASSLMIAASFLAVQRDRTSLSDDAKLRGALLDFIADFSNWDHSNSGPFLETARKLTAAAAEALGQRLGEYPTVVDPFAGGGAIPVEALRVGADVLASDLNPVAVLLNRVLVESIPKFGQRLADGVREWGDRIREEAEYALAEYYPDDLQSRQPLTYIWARTINCEGPTCGVAIPLLRSMWLAKRRGNGVALRLRADRSAHSIEFDIIENAKTAQVGPGTIRLGAVTCPMCGFTTPKTSVRRQLLSRMGGTADARLIAVVVRPPGRDGKHYRLPCAEDLEAATKAAEALRRYTGAGDLQLPDASISQERVWKNNPIRVHLYGMTKWSSLFTPRQALTLGILAKSVGALAERLGENTDREFVLAIRACLSLAVSRQADYSSSLCAWHLTREVIGHTFGRQALSMVWDFAEVNPFADTSGSFGGAVEWIAKVCASQAATSRARVVNQSSATQLHLPDDAVQAVFSDPPYYDSVPYATLADFFYVWLRLMLKDCYPELFGTHLIIKDAELVLDEAKNKDHLYYEKGMTLALAECRRIVIPAGIGVFVFAHKSTAGWEAMLKALVDAGWVVTASWPIDTEMATRLRAMNSAALASSIHLVCRPREADDGSVIFDSVGDWRDVLEELPRRIHAWLPRLAEEGVVGADAIFACLGPALEIFSRYARVEKASGEEVTLREYLEQVWAAVAREALSMIFEGAETTGFEADARLTAIWLWTLNTATKGGNSDGREEEEAEDEGTSKPAKLSGYFLEYDAARKIAQGLGAHLEKLTAVVEIKGDMAWLLPAAERAAFLFGKEAGEPTLHRRGKPRQLDMFAAIGEAEEAAGVGVASVFRPGETALDRLHQAMLLFGAGRGEALKRFLVEEGVGRDQRLWQLAQSLSALYPPHTEEKRWVDGVLARKKGLGL